MTKQNVKEDIIEIYTQCCEAAAAGADIPETDDMIKIRNQIIDYEAGRIADYINERGLTQTTYWEEPDYYAAKHEFNGVDFDSVASGVDLSCNINEFINYHVFDELALADQHRAIKCLFGIEELIEPLGLTILCKINDSGDEEGQLDIPREECVIGNLAIMSAEDWKKLEDSNWDASENSDLVWHDVYNYVSGTMANIIEDLQDEIDSWFQNSMSLLLEVNEYEDSETFDAAAAAVLELFNKTGLTDDTYDVIQDGIQPLVEALLDERADQLED